ncbi:hypothetical protein SO802_022194 [Lithocarpus litseifolius]|uniref:Acyl-[acyl-carrier-protein] desaturase n=1 Tax=Lithocarpus litseifolius TaxID=425828 RepID=A0AAW2CHE4_9ROSI
MEGLQRHGAGQLRVMVVGLTVVRSDRPGMAALAFQWMVACEETSGKTLTRSGRGSSRKVVTHPSEFNVNKAGPMLPKTIEIFKYMEDWAKNNFLTLLKPVEECWQPQDFLPDPTSDGFIEQVNELRKRTRVIPNEYFVALVGDMITEDALPTYQARINSTANFHDETSLDNKPWAIWTRAWSAEENRHGDLLNKYLFLSEKVDIKQIEKTTQYLTRSGLGNTAKLTLQDGEVKLAQVCGIIAPDEKRHVI